MEAKEEEGTVVEETAEVETVKVEMVEVVREVEAKEEEM